MDTLHVDATIPEAIITPRDILFECPNCSKSMVIDESAMGKIVDCPGCPAQVIVPSRPAPPAESERRENATTALLLAVRQGDSSSLNVALAQGADANAAGPDGMTVLMLAVQQDRGDFVETLIGHGASLEAKGPDGQTALMLAQQAGQFQLVRLLWKADTKPAYRFFGRRRRNP